VIPLSEPQDLARMALRARFRFPNNAFALRQRHLNVESIHWLGGNSLIALKRLEILAQEPQLPALRDAGSHLPWLELKAPNALLRGARWDEAQLVGLACDR